MVWFACIIGIVLSSTIDLCVLAFEVLEEIDQGEMA